MIERAEHPFREKLDPHGGLLHRRAADSAGPDRAGPLRSRTFGAETLGRSIAVYALLMFCGPYLVCTAPALILAKRNRYPAIALALCALSVAATAVLWRA